MKGVCQRGPVHTYNNGQPYRNAAGRRSSGGLIELHRPVQHSVVTGKPSSQEFLWKIKRELKIRGYARNSIKGYLSHLARFLRWFGNLPHRVTQEDVRNYLELLVDGGASMSHLGVCLSAIRTAFDKFCRRDLTLGLATPRKPKTKPTVLSTKEVGRILRAAPTPASKLAIGIMYAAGLRNSELCKLRIADIDFDRNVIQVWQGKGKTDRLVMLPRSFRSTLATMCKRRQFDEYLFPSLGCRKGRRHMSSRTLQRWVKVVVELAGVAKRVTPHTFRHAFATHLLESGTDIRFIQKLLGHRRLETTTIYTHVAQIEQQPIASPLDRICDLDAEIDNQDSSVVKDEQAGAVGVIDSVGSMKLHFKTDRDARTARVTLELLDGRGLGRGKFLTGISVGFSRENWVEIGLPEFCQWQPTLATLSDIIQRRIRSPDFFETLRRSIARRFLLEVPRPES